MVCFSGEESNARKLAVNVHLSKWVITLAMQHLHTLWILHEAYFGIIPKFDWKLGKKGK